MYRSLASVYDRLSTVDYTLWADFLEGIFDASGQRVNKVFDLACGTGSMSLELARRGYQVVGADLSAEMLSVAENKLRPFRVPLFKADMRNLPAVGEFDAVICLCDSFNYLRELSDLAKVLLEIKRMSPKMLVFDLNTPYYLKEILGNNTFTHNDEETAYIWHNSFSRKTGLCKMEITFFAAQGRNSWARFDEVHVEKPYPLELVKDLLGQAGWKLLQVYDGYCGKPAREESWRWLFVAENR